MNRPVLDEVTIAYLERVVDAAPPITPAQAALIARTFAFTNSDSATADVEAA